MVAWGLSTLSGLSFPKGTMCFVCKISGMLFKSLANIVVRTKRKKVR